MNLVAAGFQATWSEDLSGGSPKKHGAVDRKGAPPAARVEHPRFRARSRGCRPARPSMPPPPGLRWGGGLVGPAVAPPARRPTGVGRGESPCRVLADAWGEEVVGAILIPILLSFVGRGNVLSAPAGPRARRGEATKEPPAGTIGRGNGPTQPFQRRRAPRTARPSVRLQVDVDWDGFAGIELDLALPGLETIPRDPDPVLARRQRLRAGTRFGGMLNVSSQYTEAPRRRGPPGRVRGGGFAGRQPEEESPDDKPLPVLKRLIPSRISIAARRFSQGTNRWS
jgi:hypothetical protein